MPLKLYLRGGNYHYSGTVGPRGNRSRLRGSCYTSDKDIAARQIAELEAKYWKGHFDGPSAILTFAEAARIYRAAGKADKFLDKIEAHLKQTLVKDITEASVQLMAKTLYPNVSNASLNRLVIVPTLAVINHAARSKLCPRFSMERYEATSKIKDPATLEWINAFRAHANAHLGAFVLFMYLTGARPGEAINLQWSDLDLQKGTAIIRETKVYKERVAHLPAVLVAVLANLARVEGKGVFVYAASNGTRKAWASACKAADIKDLSPHSCRHGFATGLLRRGVDVVTVAWLGGWKSTQQVLKTYGHATKNPRLVELLTGPELEQYGSQLTHNSGDEEKNEAKSNAS
jgi:integrase